MRSQVESVPPPVEELLGFLEEHAARVFERPVHPPAEEFAAEDLAVTARMLVDRTRAEPDLVRSADWMTMLQLFAGLYEDEKPAPHPDVPTPRQGF